MLTKILGFLRITDSSSQLSISNLAVLALIYKVFNSPTPQTGDLVALGVVFANYAVKRVVEYQRSKLPQVNLDTQPLLKRIEELEAQAKDTKNKVSSLSMSAGLRPIPTKPFGG